MPVPFKFEIPLEKPLCDNTTKFSKWIKKKKPHLKNKILQCAAHLTGIAWQKRSHTKFFDDQATYKKFYKLVVRAEFYEEEDKPSRSERWAPRQLGGEEMVITKTLKVHSANSVIRQFLISASSTGTRR